LEVDENAELHEQSFDEHVEPITANAHQNLSVWFLPAKLAAFDQVLLTAGFELTDC
jgi:hypothetical protein